MKYRFGEYLIDQDRLELTVGGKPVAIEPQVYHVLVYLVENAGRLVTKSELLDNVWVNQFVSESALATRVKQARQAVGDDGRTQGVIRTIHGRGYEFLPTVERVTDTSAIALAPQSLASRPVSGSAVASPIRVAQSIGVDDEFPFVGRAAEREALHLAGRDQGFRNILIGGPPGVGKSRLAIELLEQAVKDGWLVGAGRCGEHITSAFQPIREALLQLAKSYPKGFRTWCEGIEPLVLRVLPSLIDQFHCMPSAGEPNEIAHEVLTTIIERASAQSKIALLIDDLQWSDDPTRSLLSGLSRRIANRQAAVLATFRTTSFDLPGVVRAWIDQEARAANASRLELEDLDADAVTELVDAVLGESGGAISLFSRTGGHSLFVVETLRDLQLGRTESISVPELVSARLEVLDEPARRLVRAAALLGNEFTFADVVRVAELPAVDGLGAVEAALGAGLIQETASPERFRFAHQLIPESIAATMSRTARAAVHHLCAEALTERRGDPVDIAIHQLGAVPLVALETAVNHARTAAASAHKDRQFDQALRLLDRVLNADIGDRTRAEVLLASGAALNNAYRVSDAVPRFEEAAQLARTNKWHDVLAEAALGLWERSPFRKRRDRSTLKLLAEALDAIGDESPELRAHLLAKTAAFSLFKPLTERGKLSHAALRMAPEASPKRRLELLELHNLTFGCPAGFDELCRIEPELLQLRAAAGGVVTAVPGLPEVLGYMRGDGALLRAEAHYLENDPNDLPTYEMRRLILQGTIAALEGDIERARQMYDASAPLGEPVWGDSGPALHALGHLFCDAIDGSWSRSPELIEDVHQFGGNQLTLPLVAWVRAETGDLTGAQTILQELNVSNLSWFAEHHIGGHALVALAEVATRLHLHELAHAVEQQLKPIASLMLGMPWAGSFAAAHALTRLSQYRGDIASAEQYRERARRLYVNLGAPALEARLVCR